MLKTLVDWTNASRLFTQCTFWGHQHVNAMQWASSTEKTVSFVGLRTILWCHYTWIIRMIYDYWDFTVVLSTDKQTSNHLKKRLHLKRTFVISLGMEKKTVASNQCYWYRINTIGSIFENIKIIRSKYALKLWDWSHLNLTYVLARLKYYFAKESMRYFFYISADLTKCLFFNRI